MYQTISICFVRSCYIRPSYILKLALIVARIINNHETIENKGTKGPSQELFDAEIADKVKLRKKRSKKSGKSLLYIDKDNHKEALRITVETGRPE